MGAKIFRNNTGVGWSGQSKRTQTGDRIVYDAQPLRAGLCTGSSDLIGWTPVEITSEMVGKTVAVFTAIEVKQPSGKATTAQINFLQSLQKDGGIAGIARSAEDAVNLIQGQML